MKTLPQRYFGMHFYPGVAEYSEPGKDPYRIFINEDTIRSMNPSFAGRPIYVEHVDEVDMENLQEDLDGVVVKSFYNAADGKTWVEFIVISDRGKQAIQNGWRLSNAYIPKSFTNGGLWNGVEYAKEVTGGEYEHLAIVRNPRYEESRILTPDEFKKYNEDKEIELKRLSNSKENKGEESMKLNIFKRQKVENSVDLEGMSVVLPKSGKEFTITQLVDEMDKIQNMHGYAANEHMVKVNDKEEMSVGDLVKKHAALNDELEMMKKKSEGGEEKHENAEMDEDEKKENDEDDKEAKKKALELAAHEDKEMAEEKKKNAADEAKAKKANFEKLKNAHLNASEEVAVVELMEDQVARGKALYGRD